MHHLQVYLKNGILGYADHYQYVNSVYVNIYGLIPIPIPFDETKFLYINKGKPFLDANAKLQKQLLASSCLSPPDRFSLNFIFGLFFFLNLKRKFELQ